MLFAFGCKSSQYVASSTDQELDRLSEMMAGYYNSSNQASQDSQFFDISLTMIPIWEDDQKARWLYVEQAVSATMKQPYRQRVYRLTKEGDVFESKVYEIPTPEKYVHLWEDKTKMEELKVASLIERDGCSVFMKAEGSCFTGSTEERSCKSSLRGASYATSIVEVCDQGIVSWDQGWNEEGHQVWGAVKGGYIFDKIK